MLREFDMNLLRRIFDCRFISAKQIYIKFSEGRYVEQKRDFFAMQTECVWKSLHDECINEEVYA